MTFPTLNDITYSEEEAGNTTSQSVTVCDNCANLDLLIIVGSIDASQGGVVTWDNTTAGTWIEYYLSNGSAGTVWATCHAKISDGTESLAVLGITTELERSVFYSFRVPAAEWFGGDGIGALVDGFFANLDTTPTGTGTDVNPPNLDPSVGAEDFTWIAVAHADLSALQTISVFSEASDQNQSSNTDNGAALVAISSRELNASSYDPATDYTMTAADQRMGATLGIRPAAPAGGPVLMPASFSQSMVRF